MNNDPAPMSESVRGDPASRSRHANDAPALLFDLDGTLTDNLVGIATSINYALAQLDHPPRATHELRDCLGPPLRDTFARLLDTADSAAIEHAIGHYRVRYADIGWSENRVYDGIEAALESLMARNLRLYVCTAKPEVYARRILNHFGLDRWLQAIYGADLDGHYDDKAKLMALILEREAIAPGRALMIGDRANDIRAARANGVRAVGVLWGYGSREELAPADRLLATPDELLHLGEEP